MPVPYQNNMYPQMPYGQQQYGVNSYIPYMQPRFQQPEIPAQQVQQQTPPVQQIPRGLNGMVVQAIENVTADCVPMDGSAAFFPKQDLSEIYVKSWCADGTIRTLTYKPVQQNTPKEVQADADKMASGLAQNVTEVFERRFNELSEKIDRLELSIARPGTKGRTATVKKDGESE